MNSERPASSILIARPSGYIPIWVSVAYTAFMAVLVPFYWRTYGPTNFLYFCDVALFLMLAALWSKVSLFASMATVGILLPQMVWCVDFLAGLAGFRLLGMTAYMFDSHLSLFARGLSLFHFWLPFLAFWTIWRLGYDRRALASWTVLAWILLIICYFLMPAPPPPPENPNLPVNINYVYGPSDEAPQHWMPARAWFAVVMCGMPTLVFLPTHLILAAVIPPPRR
jgi:hypothetical protein